MPGAARADLIVGGSSLATATFSSAILTAGAWFSLRGSDTACADEWVWTEGLLPGFTDLSAPRSTHYHSLPGAQAVGSDRW